MRIRGQRSSQLALLRAFARSARLALVALGLLACGGDKPPAQLPSTAARDRAATRVELVNLVVSDAARAGQIRALYIAMDSLLLDTKRAQASQLARLGGERPSTDEEVRARLRAVREAESSALQRYIQLQMQLRRLATAQEFARLDAIR
jgi:hypothetical protein